MENVKKNLTILCFTSPLVSVLIIIGDATDIFTVINSNQSGIQAYH